MQCVPYAVGRVLGGHLLVAEHAGPQATCLGVLVGAQIFLTVALLVDVDHLALVVFQVDAVGPVGQRTQVEILLAFGE
eukprot:15181-Eustigmatos_ZCMA.PRE.1